MLVVWAECYGNVLVLECCDCLPLLVDVGVVIEEVRTYLELLLGLLTEVPECDDVPVVEHP